MTKEFDYKLLKGVDLFTYFTQDHPDKDYSSIVAMLPNAIGDWDKAIKLLEMIVICGAKLVAIYPGQGEEPTPTMKYLGEIMDGGLYVDHSPMLETKQG